MPDASLPASEICSERSAAGIDALGQRDVEVGQEHDLQAAAHVRVVVDDARHVVDQLDDQLRHAVAGRGLAAEDDGARHASSDGRIGLDAVVERDDVQQLEVLPLVLVQALDHARRTCEAGSTVDAGPVADDQRQQLLVARLDARHSARKLGVVGERLQIAQLVEVGQPAVADARR